MLFARFKSIPWLPLALILLATLSLVSCGKKVVLEAKIAVSTSSSSAAAVDPNTIAPVISNPGDKLFPSNNLVQSTLASIDFDNANISADTGMAYTCFFDREVDGIVAATDACTSLTGGAAFNTATGVITWTPSTSAFGPYEIKATGTNAYGSASRILIADVRPLFSTTNLIRYYDSQYASTTGSQGINSPFTSSWTDLVGTLGAVTGTLTSFGATTSSGWAGSVTVAAPIANPYRLVFDGVDDHVDLGTAMNSESTLQFDTWIKPAAVATASATLLSNADTSNKGFNLYQSGLGNGKMVLSIGGIGYYQKVRAANPISYFRLAEPNSVTALADEIGTTAGVYNVAGTYNFSQTTAIAENTTGVRFTGAANTRAAAVWNAALIPNGGQRTYEMWVKYNALPAAVDELVAMGLGSAGKTWMAIQVNDPGAGYGLTFKYYDTTFHYFKHVTFATLGISAGTWYHLAYVIDHANTIARILVNGVEIATDTPVGDALAALTLIDTNSSFYIGGSPSSGGSDVTMSDVAIYNTALSTAELLSHYQAAALPTCNSTSALVNGTWTHIGGAWDNAANKLYLDVGGANQCTYTHSGAYTINGGSNNLILGRRSDGTNPWAGSVSDLRFYNVYSGTRSSTNRTATLNRY